MSLPTAPASAAASLREEFDRCFATLPVPLEPTEELLAIRVGGDSYALRLREVAEISAGHPVSRLPSTTPHLLGLAGLRTHRAGVVVPVFSLASLLGAAGGADAPRWLALCDAQEPFALAFDFFEGHLRLPAAALHPDVPGAARRFTSGLARAPSANGGFIDRTLINLSLIAAALLARSDPARRTKEQ